VPIKGASIRLAKQINKPSRVSFPWMNERVGKSSVAQFLEDVVGAHALRHLQKLRLGIFSCKPLNDYISSNSVGERIGKSPVAHLHF
jgi:hypothetical protein